MSVADSIEPESKELTCLCCNNTPQCGCNNDGDHVGINSKQFLCYTQFGDLTTTINECACKILLDSSTLLPNSIVEVDKYGNPHVVLYDDSPKALGEWEPFAPKDNGYTKNKKIFVSNHSNMRFWINTNSLKLIATPSYVLTDKIRANITINEDCNVAISSVTTDLTIQDITLPINDMIDTRNNSNDDMYVQNGVYCETVKKLIHSHGRNICDDFELFYNGSNVQPSPTVKESKVVCSACDTEFECDCTTDKNHLPGGKYVFCMTENKIAHTHDLNTNNNIKDKVESITNKLSQSLNTGNTIKDKIDSITNKLATILEQKGLSDETISKTDDMPIVDEEPTVQPGLPIVNITVPKTGVSIASINIDVKLLDDNSIGFSIKMI
jgi:hypothetical protein